MKLSPNITILFSIWFLSLVFIFCFGFLIFPGISPRSPIFVDRLGNWDGAHFLDIAQNGYTKNFQYAFFPLYPILIRFLSLFTQDYLLSALIISVGAFFFGLQFLYKLVAIDFGKSVAEKTCLALLFFPTSFYFMTAYSEGLFLFLSVGGFYFLRKNKLFLATLLISLASATRITGLAAVIALLFYVQLHIGINRRNAFVLLAPFGFIIYCIFLYTQTSDPLYFLTAEKHWQRYLSIPGFNFWETIRSLATPNILFTKFNIFLDLIFAIFGVGLVVRSFRFLPFSYSLFSLVSLGIPLFTPILTSMPRFLLPVFPLFILLGLIKNKYLILSYQVISLMILSVFAVLFINGLWVS